MIRDLHLIETEKTPHILCSVEGKIAIEGISIPENANEYYSQLIKWIEDYLSADSKSLELRFYLTYFNTSSNQVLGYIFRILSKSVQERGHEVYINWLYESGDMDMEDVGLDFKKIYPDINFKIIEVE